MRHTIFTLLMSIIFIASAFAELPLEENWSVELDSATALGNAWVDEDGNQKVLVGDGWQAKLISNGEVFWESDSLIGPVTALLRVPYESGEQILIAATGPLREPVDMDDDSLGYGYLYRINAEEFEQISMLRLGEYWQVSDIARDSRNLTCTSSESFGHIRHFAKL